MKNVNFDQTPSSLLSQVFENSPNFMAFLESSDLVIKFANEPFKKIMGQHDILGKKFTEAFPEVVAQGFLDILKDVYASQRPYTGTEIPVHLKNDAGNKLYYLDFIYQPIIADSGNVVGILVQGHDVTEKVYSRKAIENERANFRLLFKQTPEMVCILRGPDHLFEFVNEAHVKVLGFDATGKTVREAQPESVEVHGILDKVYSTGVTAELKEIPVTLGDRLRYFNLTYAARWGDAGDIIGIMILGLEVTDQVTLRKDLEKSRAQIYFERHLIDNIFHVSPAAMALWKGKDLVFEKVNMAYQKIFPHRELIGKPLVEAVPELRDQSFIKKLEDVFNTGEPYVGIEEVAQLQREVDGPLEDRYFDFVYLQIKDIEGKPYGIYDHAIDVTDRVMARRELEIAKEAAIRANKLKSAFLANMSHEIRTPLGALMGFADLLRDPELSQYERENYIDIILRNSEQLSIIINDIIDISKVEADFLTLEYLPMSPEQIAMETIALLQIKAKEKGLELKYIKDPSTHTEVVSDSTRVRQVLLNLVSNAIKFTHQGHIEIRSFGGLNENQTKMTAFEIRDTGIGIPEEQQERIFEMFVQADNSITRNFGGTGLGLSLSRKLANKLGGHVRVKESAPQKGSTFLFTFQDKAELLSNLPKMQITSHSSYVVGEKPIEGARVLVVDDSEDNQEIFSTFLARAGAQVEIADNGIDGYKKALAGNYDIVLMDIQMPQMDGYTATQKLREHGFKKPVIALTAHAMSEVRKKCLNVGCTDYLSKPIQPKELVGIVARYTQK